MTTVIKVEGLCKRYSIGASETRRDNIREVIIDTIKAPFRRFFSSSVGGTGKDIDFWALRDVSFDVQEGDVVGIIGRNGAGKSTLLKILSKITEPTSGHAKIKGRIASLLEVGTGFHPELTGRENIFLNGAILGMTRVEINRKFDEIVDFSEIEKFLDTPVKRYSSGMYVRLAFAVAAHLDPEILIIDEVLAVGDVQFQKKCLGKMQHVSKEGRTVLFVSHNMAAVEQLTKQSLLLKAGEVTCYGKTSDVIGLYLNQSSTSPLVRFDVENTPRKYIGNQLVRFIEFRFERDTPIFYPYEDFQFIARIRASADVQNIRTSMTIFANDGTPIGSCFGPYFMNLEEGLEAEIQIILPQPMLAPGFYSCGVAIGKGDHISGHVDFDVVLDTLAFEVRPEVGDGGTLSHWVHNWGCIVFAPLHQKILTLE